ncbi:MAG: hypothetical protein LUP97_03400 [Methanoregula sp.]|nr:hypothetical protein [Methanoregula sp.]
MPRRIYLPLIVLTALTLIASPAVASLYLTSESFTPNAPLLPGTGQHSVVTFSLLPAGSTTFIWGHELQMQTDLTNAQWNIQVIDNGLNAAQQPATGTAAFVNGMILSYPNSHDVSLSVMIDGTVPPPAGTQVTVLKVEEIDNSGHIVPGSIMTFVEPVADQTTSPAPPQPPTLTHPPVPSPPPSPTQSDGFTLVPVLLALTLILGLARLRRG